MNPAIEKSIAFIARRPWWGGDLQTLRNYALNARDALPTKGQRMILPLDDGSGDRLVATLHRPQGHGERPLVALIHGLAGCERSCYIAIATTFFLLRGYPVLTVNLRGAGPSRPLCRGQYHAGSSGDFAALLDNLAPSLTCHGVLPVGFSLGGNMLLKFLGEAGRHGLIPCAAVVSAPIDLACSSRALLRWRNFGYQRYLLAAVKRTCTAPGAKLTPAERKAVLGAASIWQFDETFTAPRNGYPDAEAFYAENSSQRFLATIAIDTLLIHAKDDPFVPVDPYLEQDWSTNPRLFPLLPDGGGHLGFHDPLGLWHLRQIADFFDSKTGG